MEPSPKIDLSDFSIGDYDSGPKWKILIWTFINYFIFYTALPWPYGFKRFLLKLFGAKLGRNLIIKINVRIKYPWKLIIGNNCWIGEDVWIDNLDDVVIGSNVCLSQGSMLLTGNHDYTISSFPYRLGKITIHDGVWIGARSVVCPGVTCQLNSILTVNSVANKDLSLMTIYSGNPAQPLRKRVIKDNTMKIITE
ncbi:MAG TPA: WcaF family extracellular polysaccharide biosynthesis acetyltransferase [Flavitalea sp.]|nr:WcaF family extracellular polysaccharide biosynthesis acetyltransferase [Flavitalea sp.]